MAKNKGAASSAVANRPAYSRVSFLYQAAALLAARSAAPATLPSTSTPAPTTATDKNDANNSSSSNNGAAAPDANLMGMSRRLLTQMRSVSRKTNMRLRPAVKHRVCKFCDTLLVEGATCTSVVENQSRGGRKPWADMLAVACTTCGRVRRYPVSAPRQARRPLRGAAGAAGGMVVPPATKKENQQQKGKKSGRQGKSGDEDEDMPDAKSGPG